MSVVELRPPLCTCPPQRISRPRHILPLLNSEHPGAKLVSFMAVTYPRSLSRQALREVVQLDGSEPRHSAAFEWLLMRINDTLPLTGWRINEDKERYRLERDGWGQ